MSMSSDFDLNHFLRVHSHDSLDPLALVYWWRTQINPNHNNGDSTLARKKSKPRYTVYLALEHTLCTEKRKKIHGVTQN